MILEHAILPVIPGQEEAFLQAFAEARQIISAAEGFLSLTLDRCVERPHEFLLQVRWSTLEAHTAGFRGSADYLRWKELLHHFYEPFPEVTHFRALPT